MRLFAMLLLMSISSISLCAGKRNIELQEQAHHKGVRSLSYKPTVTYDGNILIHSEIALEGLQVLVTDLDSGITYCYNNITVANCMPYTLQLQNIETGNYKLELIINQKSYYGYFEVTP